MNENSKNKIHGLIGSTLRDLINRDMDMTARARVIDQKQKELAELQDAYQKESKLQDSDYESIVEFIKLRGATPRQGVLIAKWREWYNYHPDRETMGSSDYVMGKIAELLSDKEDEDVSSRV